MNRKAFTLIELLVVIAIIAILAAILFPVFAQAKAAAKKTAALAQIKQLGTSAALYLSDNDDNYMLAYAKTTADGWLDNKAPRTPANWNAAWTNEEVNAFNATWANSIQPYLKSYALLHAPGETMVNASGVDYTNPRATPEWSNFAFNGNLTEYNATAINAPSQLISFWQATGVQSTRGYGVTSPWLQCDVPDQACRYVPSYAACDNSQNGNWDYFASTTATMWVYGKGANAVMSDSSAKFKKLGMNVLGRTDYRNDPYSQYAANGTVPGMVGWYDEYACHAMLFRPEFDFQTWGNPIEL